MGIYLFSIRAKAHEMRLPDGKLAQVNEIRFLFNGGSFFTPTRLQKASQAKAEAYWDGKKLPEYVVMVHGVASRPQGGSKVYRWTGSGPLWVDCGKFPGEVIGEILDMATCGTPPPIEMLQGRLCVGPHACAPLENAWDMLSGQDLCRGCGNRIGEPRPERLQAHQETFRASSRARQEAEAQATLSNWERLLST